MGGSSKIEWTDASWNPVTGCTKVSAGCKNCYAEGIAKRFWPAQYPPVRVVPVPGDGDPYDRPRRFTDVRCHDDRLDQPLRWRKPRRVFVNSMSDLFHEDIPDEFIAAVFIVMKASPLHSFQILTKRPQRMLGWIETVGQHGGIGRWLRDEPHRFRSQFDAIAETEIINGEVRRSMRDPFCQALNAAAISPSEWPLRNVHLGTSCENQPTADERIPLLLQTPAAVRFVSLEPLLEAVDIEPFVRRLTNRHVRLDIRGALRNRAFDGLTSDAGEPLSRSEAERGLRSHLERGDRFLPVGDCPEFDTQTGCPGHPLPRLDQVIVGGESGPKARPCDVQWIRSIVRQCQGADVPVFVKQLGGNIRERNDAGFFGDCELDAWCLDDDQVIDNPNGFREHYQGAPVRIKLRDRKGGDPSEWPEDLRVRQNVGALATKQSGK